VPLDSETRNQKEQFISRAKKQLERKRLTAFIIGSERFASKIAPQAQ